MKELIRPGRIRQGDTIGICAPSGAFEQERFDAGIEVLRDMGFRTKIFKGIKAKKRFLAGDDLHRAEGVNAMFADPEVKAILCARGGFGALRMLQSVDYQIIENNPKLFVGFSDITALLNAIMMTASIQVVHGPVLTSLADAGTETRESLFLILTQEPSSAVAVGKEALRKGRAEGVLAGGNLATLTHLTGTAWQPEFADVVLFLEDVGEAPYRIDRMLSHLKAAGVLGGVSGVLIGSLEKCGDQDLIHEILLDIFDDETVPVLAGIESGHGPMNLSLPLGCRVVMDAGALRVDLV